jgi:hypothetical protein
MNGAEIVRYRALAIAAVAALVSTRVYCGLLPQNTRAAAVRISMIAGAPEGLHLRGRTGVVTDRVQVDAYAASDAADPLGQARALMTALCGDTAGSEPTGLIGWFGSIGSPSTRVDLIEPASQPIEQYQPDELRLWVVSQDMYVHYRA